MSNVSRTFKLIDGEFQALKNINLHLSEGEMLAIIGESGSGKSTILKQIACLDTPNEGTVILKGKNVTGKKPADVCHSMQMVFQDARGSFNPRMTFLGTIRESLKHAGIKDKDAQIKKAEELVEMVGLNKDVLKRYPANLSGGQCQRMAIARALAAEPEIILCDEATSALDVSAQAQIIRLLKDLNESLGLSVIFVSHDIALVDGMCDRVMVMKSGQIVEEGPIHEVLSDPKNEYTKQLISSILSIKDEPITFAS
ncbi:MAG: ABC transporter ATP-binding protein [Firmicutes bacterium]|nr:ABC transporter ATP-binding protein [Bacillota bacterium]